MSITFMGMLQFSIAIGILFVFPYIAYRYTKDVTEIKLPYLKKDKDDELDDNQD